MTHVLLCNRFLMNNVSFYFRSTINSRQFAYTTLNKLYLQAAEKYIACCQDFKMFHARTAIAPQIDLKICQIVYVVIRSFFKYLVCNVKPSVFDKSDYQAFFKYSLSYFARSFMGYKNQFRGVVAILKAKMQRFDEENAIFEIN